MNTLELLVTCGMGLVGGAYFKAAVIVIPGQRRLSASAYIEGEQANNRYGRRVMPALIVMTIILQTLFLISLHDNTSTLFKLTLVSIVLNAIVMIFTRIKIVPINHEIEGFSATRPPANWQMARNKWHLFHLMRTVVILTSMVLQFVAVLHS